MADDSGQQQRSKRTRQLTDRVRDEREPARHVASQLVAADQLINVLRELHLIPMSTMLDRRSIAFAAASLRAADS